MKARPNTLRTSIIAMTAFATVGVLPAAAEDIQTLKQGINLFENGQATGGQAMTVDTKGPVPITDDVELPMFAFAVYDVDFTSDSLTMKLIAELEKLQITQYDETTFDRYYFAFDQEIKSAKLSNLTDANFSATVEVVAPGTEVTSAGAFIDGMASEFSLDQGGILITVGAGTDLTAITENGGSLTVDFE